MAALTVLIADDDSDLVHMLALSLQGLGLEVFRSPDAMHALVGTHRARPDLVVLDVNMPGGNGLSVCEMLADNERTAHIPVIVMSGQSAIDIRRRCYALGAHYVIKGPRLLEEVEFLAAQLLGLRRDRNRGQSRADIARNSLSADEGVVSTSEEFRSAH